MKSPGLYVGSERDKSRNSDMNTLIHVLHINFNHLNGLSLLIPNHKIELPFTSSEQAKFFRRLNSKANCMDFSSFHFFFKK